MKKYTANIVGYKWRKEKYYPIFEYKDDRGNVRQYIRKKPVEKNPYTRKQNYTICVDEGYTYEKTERKLCLKKYFLPLRTILFFASMFFKWKIFLLVASFLAIIHMSLFLKDVAEGWRVRKLQEYQRPICGTIKGYKRLKKRSSIINRPYLYYPIVEYMHEGCFYSHISSKGMRTKEYDIGNTCNVYLDKFKKCVYDEFDLSLPIVDISLFVDLYSNVRKKFEKRDNTKVYVPNSTVAKPVSVMSTNTITLPSTAALKNVSGWY